MSPCSHLVLVFGQNLVFISRCSVYCVIKKNLNLFVRDINNENSSYKYLGIYVVNRFFFFF